MTTKQTGRPKSTRPVPACFKLHAQFEGDLRLRARYNVGRSLILRWREETGVYCGTPRGPKRMASRSGATRPKPYRSPARSVYHPRAMDEISWYDAQDDIGTVMNVSGISVWGD